MRIAHIHFTLAAVLCILGALLSLPSCSSRQRYPDPPMQGNEIVLPTASLPHEIPQYYSYRAKDRYVNFFVIRMHDRVLAFLDACLTCYPRKLGYAARDGFVVCRACDTSYSVYKLEKGIGGCYPIRIAGSDKGEVYRITRSELDRHAGKF